MATPRFISSRERGSPRAVDPPAADHAVALVQHEGLARRHRDLRLEELDRESPRPTRMRRPNAVGKQREAGPGRRRVVAELGRRASELAVSGETGSMSEG